MEDALWTIDWAGMFTPARSILEMVVRATIMYFAIVALLARRPIRTFRIVAAVVLVLSFATPLTIPGTPLSMILTLELMHVVAAVIIAGMLTMLARAK